MTQTREVSLFHSPELEAFQDALPLWARLTVTQHDPTSTDPLEGNVSDSVKRIEEMLCDHEAASQEAFAAIERIDFIRASIGSKAILAPVPDHGIRMIAQGQNQWVDLSMRHTNPRPSRPLADATLVSESGNTSLIAPGDCPVINIVHAAQKTSAVSQIHAGVLGLAKGVIPATLESQESLGFRLSDAMVYIGPHAHGHTVYGQPLDMIRRAGFTEPDYLRPTDTVGEYEIAMSAIAVRQLVDAGIKEDNIVVDPANTRTDPRLFSNRLGSAGRHGQFLSVV